MKTKEALFILLRYSILLIIALFCLPSIYKILTPLTIYPVFYLLKIFYPFLLLSNFTLSLNSFSIGLVPACIAGSAYLLLFILNLTTPLKPMQRLKSFTFLIISFLLINTIRIFLFSVLFFSGFSYFSPLHEIFWYFISIILVISLWFINIHIFNIGAIPFYTDARAIYAQAKRLKTPRKTN